MNAYDRVKLSRAPGRICPDDIIEKLFSDPFEFRGDRSFAEDGALRCLVAMFGEMPVTVAAIGKGKGGDERVSRNYGMPQPEGYRKFARVLARSVKFSRPLITLVDTPGAYPGTSAEERGQGHAIAQCIASLIAAPIPVISIVTGEGGSGGALALCAGDRLLMLENAIFSVLSPEGFASILYKDQSKAMQAAELMKLTANDLLELGIADRVIPETDATYEDLCREIASFLDELAALSPDELIRQRHARYASF